MFHGCAPTAVLPLLCQTTYGNGATGAADASVGLFVVSAFMCIIMYKTVRASIQDIGEKKWPPDVRTQIYSGHG